MPASHTRTTARPPRRMARAVRAAVAQARDPECHFLLTDSTDLPNRIEVLVAAARLVRSRRHQMVVVLDEGAERAGERELIAAMARLGRIAAGYYVAAGMCATAIANRLSVDRKSVV